MEAKGRSTLGNFGIILFLDGSEGWYVKNSILEEMDTVSVTETVCRWIDLVVQLEVTKPLENEVSVTSFPFILSKSKVG